MSRSIHAITLGLALATTVASARELEVNPERAFVIDQQISRGNILPLGQELIELSLRDNSKPADLVLSSPGGDVMTGFIFISQMETAKANGLKLRCFVPTMAASMAFGILVHCDERHALDNSFLLWHRARSVVGGLFGSAMAAPELLALGRELQKLDDKIFRETLEALHTNEKYVRYHFENQTLHLGSVLAEHCPKFIDSRPHVKGLMEALTDKKVRRVKQDTMFGSNQYHPGQIIYILPSLIGR